MHCCGGGGGGGGGGGVGFVVVVEVALGGHVVVPLSWMRLRDIQK